MLRRTVPSFMPRVLCEAFRRAEGRDQEEYGSKIDEAFSDPCGLTRIFLWLLWSLQHEAHMLGGSWPGLPAVQQAAEAFCNVPIVAVGVWPEGLRPVTDQNQDCQQSVLVVEGLGVVRPYA